MVFTTERFFEEAIESWPESDLNPGPLNSIKTLWPTELSGHEFNSHSKPTLYSYSNFIVVCSVSHTHTHTHTLTHTLTHKYIYILDNMRKMSTYRIKEIIVKGKIW